MNSALHDKEGELERLRSQVLRLEAAVSSHDADLLGTATEAHRLNTENEARHVNMVLHMEKAHRKKGKVWTASESKLVSALQSKCLELDKTLEDAGALAERADELEGRNAQLRGELAAAQRELASGQRELRAREQALEQFVGYNQEQQGALLRLGGKLEAVSKAKGRISDQRNEDTRTRAALMEDHGKQMSAVADQLRRRDEQLAETDERLAKTQAEMAGLEARLEAKAAAVKDADNRLREEVHRMQLHVQEAESKRTVAERDQATASARLQVLTTDMSSSAAETVLLKARLDEANRYLATSAAQLEEGTRQRQAAVEAQAAAERGAVEATAQLREQLKAAVRDRDRNDARLHELETKDEELETKTEALRTDNAALGARLEAANAARRSIGSRAAAALAALRQRTPRGATLAMAWFGAWRHFKNARRRARRHAWVVNVMDAFIEFSQSRSLARRAFGAWARVGARGGRDVAVATALERALSSEASPVEVRESTGAELHVRLGSFAQRTVDCRELPGGAGDATSCFPVSGGLCGFLGGMFEVHGEMRDAYVDEPWEKGGSCVYVCKYVYMSIREWDVEREEKKSECGCFVRVEEFANERER